MKNNGNILKVKKSMNIATYILCGFLKFESIGIQIGGIGAQHQLQKENRGLYPDLECRL